MAFDLERKLGQLLIQRLARIVAESGDFAAIAILERERLQNIVHVGGFEIEPGGFAGRKRAGALEVADAALIEDDFADGNVGGQRGCHAYGG